jgi:tetratricopeptide (TPR) repeat protein
MAAGANAEAASYLERAAALVPLATGADAPRRLLATLARGDGDLARASALLAEELAADHAALDAARELAALAAASGDVASQALAHRRIAEVWPYEASSHSALGRMALSSGDADGALARFRLALAAGPDDLVGARTDHAEALLLTGSAEAAKAELLAALSDAPLYDRAQGLLLSIVERGRPGERR